VVALLAVKPRKARLLATRHAAEEGVIGLLQSGQHVLQDVAVDVAVLGQSRSQILQLCFLLEARAGDAPLAPERDALL